MAVYKIYNIGTKKYLNVYGSNVKGTDFINNYPINLWTDSESGEQLWVIPSLSGETQIKSYLNFEFGLNALHNSTTKFTCDLHEFKNNAADSTVVIKAAATGSLNRKIKLANCDMYLTADIGSNGEKVYWAPESDSAYQTWILTEKDVIEAGKTTTIYAKVGTTLTASLSDSEMKTNAKYIYNFLEGKGFNKNAICAMLGNFQAESSLNPGIWQSSSKPTDYGYGVPQWTPATYFLDWAVAIGLISSPTKSAIDTVTNTKKQRLMDAELTFLMWTIEKRGSYFNDGTWTIEAFKTSNQTVAQLTQVFYNNYEHTGDNSLPRRKEYAANWETYFS